MKIKDLFIVVNVDWFFLSHRLPLAIKAKESGFRVTILTTDTGKRKEIESYGLRYVEIPLQRGKTTILKEFNSIFFLLKFLAIRPKSIFYFVGLKLILFGTISNFFNFRGHRVINALSGAGTMFTTSKNSFSFKILILLFKILNKKKYHYIFQNKDDLELFRKISKKVQLYSLIKGSGVDLTKFKYKKTPLDTPKIFLFVGRLLLEKGLVELVECARILEPYLKGTIKFIVVGERDEFNPSCLSEGFINGYQIQNYFEWVGYKKNVNELIESSYCVVLPSYREGLPKTLIEACAVGRSIITTNTTGCKEVVTDGHNGLLVEPKDVYALSDAIKYLVNNENKAEFMGINGRRLAEKEFDLNIILQKNIQILRTL